MRKLENGKIFRTEVVRRRGEDEDELQDRILFLVHCCFNLLIEEFSLGLLFFLLSLELRLA